MSILTEGEQNLLLIWFLQSVVFPVFDSSCGLSASEIATHSLEVSVNKASAGPCIAYKNPVTHVVMVERRAPQGLWRRFGPLCISGVSL